MIEEYLEAMRQRGYHHDTIAEGRRFLRKLSEYLQEVHSTKPLGATEEMIEGFVLDLKTKKTLGPKAISTVVGRIKKFYEFCQRRKVILKNPTLNLDPCPNFHPLRDIPDHSTIEVLLNSPDPLKPKGLRDRAIFELLYSSGIRGEELRNLKVSDVDLKDQTVTVTRGKGGKGRVVPIGQEASRWIGEYLERTRPLFLNHLPDNLFLTPNGRSLYRGSFQDVFRPYKRKYPKLSSITPHLLRHACAIGMLRGGAPIHMVQKMLGHKLPSTTQIYTRLYPKDLKEAHEKFHPREKQKED
jgi:integrase/recombinase XerD